MNDNSFTGQIPTSFKNLDAMYELYLQNNALSGTIPSLGTNLRFLYFFFVPFFICAETFLLTSFLVQSLHFYLIARLSSTCEQITAFFLIQKDCSIIITLVVQFLVQSGTVLQ